MPIEKKLVWLHVTQRSPLRHAKTSITFRTESFRLPEFLGVG